MQTESKISENICRPLLKAFDNKKLSKGHYVQRIINDENYIVGENTAYVVKNAETNVEIKRITIAQNDKGIDVEDRIRKLKLILEK